MTVLGRDAELARLREPLDRARAGGGAALLVTGPPGIGKSELLQAAIDDAEDFQVLRATGIEAESELPFASLQQLLRPLLPRAEELPSRLRAALDAALALGVSEAQDGFAVFAAVVSLLGICSEQRPLL